MRPCLFLLLAFAASGCATAGNGRAGRMIPPSSHACDRVCSDGKTAPLIDWQAATE